MRRLPWFVVALVLVAGCGGSSGEPRTVPPVPGASPIPSPSASLTPEAQVLAAVRAYYAALNEAGATGQTSDLATRSTSECPCRQVITYIGQLRSKRQRLVNARDDLISVSVQSLTRDVATALVRYTAPAHQVVSETSGQVLESFPSKTVSVQVALKSVNGRWLVALSRELS